MRIILASFAVNGFWRFQQVSTDINVPQSIWGHIQEVRWGKKRRQAFAYLELTASNFAIWYKISLPPIPI